MHNPTEVTEKTDEQSKSRLLSHKIKRRMFAVAISVAITSFGETIAWWRFADLGPNGGKTTSETVLSNSVNEELFPASPRSFDGHSIGTDSDLMPSCTVPFANCQSLKVVDPVTGTSYPMVGALSCPWNGDGTGKSGGAVVDVAEGSPELYGVKNGVQGDFTFECFFRTTAAGLARSQKMEPLASIASPYGGQPAAWSLIIYGKHLWCECTSETTAGGYTGSSTPSGRGAEVTPDTWHHAAIVYSVATKTFSVYLDYVYVTGYTFPDTCTGVISVNSTDSKLRIGKIRSASTDRSFNGEIAEARFSDVALAPGQFLHLREESNGDRLSSDPDMFCWFSMDSLGYGTSFLADNPALAADSSTTFFGSIVLPEGGREATVSTERLGAYGVVRASRTDTADKEIKNLGSLAFFTNNCPNSYLRISDGDKKIGGTNFTAEIFFRAAHRAVSDGTAGSYYGLLGNEAFALLVDPSNGKLYASITCEGGTSIGQTISSERVDDGVWHHLAMTYDKSLQKACFYIDYDKVKEIEGVTFSDALIGSAITVGCSRRSGSVRNFDGWIDEVRFTGRVLGVSEFIVACPSVSSSQLVRIPFDGDSMMLPYGLPGKESAYVGNKAPTAIPNGVGRYVVTGEDWATVVTNGGAYRMEGGVISYPHVDAIERSNVTIEFFWRPFEKGAPWPSPLGLSGTARASIEMSTDGIWNFYYSSGWSKMKLVFQFATLDNGVRKVSSAIDVSPIYNGSESHQSETPGWFLADFDCKWHHVAVTLREFEEAGVVRTEAISYFDYHEKARTTLDGSLCTTGTSGLMMQRSNGSYNRLATWDIDEVRITNGVLLPASFCRRTLNRGIVLSFK